MKNYEWYKCTDFQHLWHPFTQHQLYFESGDPLIVERAEGVELIDVNGHRYLDGVSSIWCNVHGHGVPELVKALQRQAELLCHSTLLGLSHTAVLELTEVLLTILPSNLTRVFYADSGSNAVEAALRMAFEWWHRAGGARGQKKNRFISLVGSYHGDTLGAVGVGFVDSFHAHLRPITVQASRFHPPHVFRFFESMSEQEAEEASLAELRQLLEAEGEHVAAIIFEPLMQAAGGMWKHSARYLREVTNLCRAYEVLVIADEVATGFGKSGAMFAVEWLSGESLVEQHRMEREVALQPDLLVLGKGLSGGYLPISAVAASAKIFDGFLGRPEEYRAFSYGQTFAGNPLAAAVARANIEYFENHQVLPQTREHIKHFHNELRNCLEGLAHVDEIRKCGVMIGIELTADVKKRLAYDVHELAAWKICRYARQAGVLIRPLGNVIVLMPPLAMGTHDLSRMVRVVRDGIESILGSK